MKRKNLLTILTPGMPKSQKRIEAIRKDFLSNDIKYKNDLRNGKNVTIDLNKSKIQVEVIVGKSTRIMHDELGFEEEVVENEFDLKEMDFYEEFDSALEIVFENYCEKFPRELDRKGVYTVELLEGLKKNKLKNINDFIQHLQTNSDIEKRVKESLREFYSKLYDFISNFKNEDYQISQKLKFKLNKNQLLWFFHSMYDKGIISGITASDLYRILERSTMYWDKQSKEYKDMKGLRIQLNKLINEHTSPQESIEVLSKTFNPNFFSSSN